MWDLRDKKVFQVIKLCFMCSRDYLSGATSAPSPQGDWTSTRKCYGKDWAYIVFLLRQWQPVGGPWRNPMFGKRPVELPLSQVCRCAHFTITVRHHLLLFCVFSTKRSISCYVNVLTKNCFFCQTEYCHVTHLPNNVIVNEIGRLPHAARQGQRLTFRCSRHGQVLHGANSVECLANGEWSHPFPTCGGKPVGSTRSL